MQNDERIQNLSNREDSTRGFESGFGLRSTNRSMTQLRGGGFCFSLGCTKLGDS